MARKKVIAGNWKMNKTASEGAELIAALKAECGCKGCCPANAPEIIVCPPFTTLSAALAATEGTPIKVGAQNVHWAANGAFTGEISAAMLTEMGIKTVIIGHSERRQYFGETDETVNQRVKAALAAGMTVILCVGETLAEREKNVTDAIIEKQVRWDLADVTAEQMANVIIAYEPVWAIGTGKVATDEQAQEVHAGIRALLAKLYGAEVSEATRILYGGSMKPANAAGLLAQKDIDGGLIGGAALKAADFLALIKAAL